MRRCTGLLVCVIVVASATTALAKPDDHAITRAVEDEILADPAVDLNGIDVETNQGVVVLSGSTDNLLGKRRATRLAEVVRGVRAVVNRIDVLPPDDRSDADVAKAVRDALLYDRATDSYEVTVEVDQGTATLTGTVDSWQEKELCGTVAAGVPGVTAIDNRIGIDFGKPRLDSEIRNDILEALRWDVRVDDALVGVKVEHGDVTLTGTVGSAAEKRQAAADAWVHGVHQVETSGLEVKRWARDDDLREGKYVEKPDEDIRDAVKDALVYDPRVFSFRVTPSVDHGVVTLEGKVDNLMARRAAEMDARNTVGVVDVRNRIRVDLPAPTDERIAKNVKDALEADAWVDGDAIDVDVHEGTVTLRGEVDSYFDKARADSIASRAHGVATVENLLEVRRLDAPLVYDPYVDTYDHRAYTWYDFRPPVTYESDATIQRDIRDRLWWSPFVDSDDVHVSVDDGVAHLTGTVDTPSERRIAAENAFEGGAIWVDNDLIVK